MKKLMFLAAAVLALAVSCTKEKGPQPGDTVKLQVAITKTKASVKTSWNEYDKISLFSASAPEGTEFVTYYSGEKAQFEGKYITGDIIGFYPAGKATFENGSLKIELPQDGSFSPMVGTGDFSNGITFSPCAGALKVKIAGSGVIKSVSIEADKPLSGNATIADGKLTIESGEGLMVAVNETVAGEKELVLTAPEATYASLKVIIEGKTNKVEKEFTNIAVDANNDAPVLDLEYEEAINLSETDASNCYLVTGAGKYVFDAKKANGETISGGVEAAMLWTEVKSELVNKVITKSASEAVADNAEYIIKNVSFNKDDNTIFFEGTGNLGNAVIALVNNMDEIIWSWHIWSVGNQTVDVPWCSNVLSIHNMTINWMTLNIGALSSTVSDPYSQGLLFQWGRKDPFLGSSSYTESKNEYPVFVNTATFPGCEFSVDKESTDITVNTTISHPTCLYSLSVDALKSWATDVPDNAWGDGIPPFGDGDSLKTLNKNFHVGYLKGIDPKENCTDLPRKLAGKGVFDPCPQGYRLPTAEEFCASLFISDATYTALVANVTKVKASDTSTTFTHTNSYNQSVLNIGHTSWWNDGVLTDGAISKTPYYWTATVARINYYKNNTPKARYGMRYLLGGTENRFDDGGPISGARPVRCIKIY